MGNVTKILLLAGTTEARQIALACGARGIALETVMSEAPRGMTPMPVAYEVLDAVTADVLAARTAEVDAVIDASHGFDSAMTSAGFAAAQAAGLPVLSVTRDAWDISEDVHWRAARDVAATNAMIPEDARVFAATGWGSLPDFAAFRGARLYLRQTTAHDRQPPYDFVELVFGDAPFTAEGERALFERLGIELLICRNLGGVPSRPKLEAAKAMGLPVILIDRPAKPEGLQIVRTVDEVMAWVDAL